ncbi:MAG: hypothetical protein K1Y02_22095 [Candidatus Hydrogenedentes bacterium]|nr:hypothetical protein [Candidatus Hydrogenedentota bacterium]
MAYGDLGGPVTELVLTCKTLSSGPITIAPGDAVKLAGPYTVDNATAADDPVFGQALAAASVNGQAVPIKVRGVCLFAYTGAAPTINGVAGIAASDVDGKVKAPSSGNGTGINLKVDTGASLVHVLL